MDQPDFLDDYIPEMPTVLELVRHIDRPCVEPRTGQHIRHVYLNIAKNMLPNLTNPGAIQYLTLAIQRYEPGFSQQSTHEK